MAIYTTTTRLNRFLGGRYEADKNNVYRVPGYEEIVMIARNANIQSAKPDLWCCNKRVYLAFHDPKNRDTKYYVINLATWTPTYAVLPVPPPLLLLASGD
jgi:hypothetical protein